jgi:acetyl-CoA C-acetyltransferase
MSKAVILSACRSAVGRFGGTLTKVTDRELGAALIAGALQRAGISGDQVDVSIFSQQYRTGEMPANSGRVVSVDAGIPIEVPNYTIAMACGGSIQTTISAAQAIKAGDARLVVSGGLEHMSNAAYLLAKARWGLRLGHGQLMDQLVLFDPISGNTMGETAENVAEKYQVSREDQDALALVSQQRTEKAMEQGLFEEQIVPITIPQRKGDPIIFNKDEHPRPGTTAEQLAKLRPVFREGGTVTAGNSSGMNDGGGALVIASGEKAAELGIRPMAEIMGYAAVGVEPSLMGIGPIDATRKALKSAGLALEDLDLIELNEAFASQSLACIRELGLDMDKVNVNGGAIALGHPISGTGAVITTKLIYELKRSGKELGLATMCVGGGQGVALIVKNLA